MIFLLKIFFLVVVCTCSPQLYSQVFFESQIVNKTLNYDYIKSKPTHYVVLNYVPTWEDPVYDWGPKGRIDVNNDGRIDFCRTVWDAKNPTIACDIGLRNQWAYSSISNIDLGYSNMSRGFVDANGDGYGDFCRCVGKAPFFFVSCMLGEPAGFSTDQYGFLPQVDPKVMCI